MDFLAKKREFVFVNIQHKQIRIHMQKVQINDYDLWVEHRSKQYRRAIQVILPILNELDNGNLPSIAFVAADKIGKDNLGSYSNEQDAIFLNVDFFQENNQRLNSAFSENTLTEVLLHELAHKQHWDAVKRFHHAHRFRYNSLQESKHVLDQTLERYVSEKTGEDRYYLMHNVSRYAYDCFVYEKKVKFKSDN